MVAELAARTRIVAFVRIGLSVANPVRTLPQRAILLFVALLLCAPALFAAERYGTDLSGRPVNDLAGPNVRFVVLIFAASDCPISNRYVPEIARLNREFAPQGVRFWWVFPNPDDSASVVAQHIRDFSIGEDAILDTRQSLVHLAQATITPEAAILAVDSGSLRQLYRGRIDDRYLSIGQERPQASLHDLESAIAAALAGKPIPRPGGPPVGCSIVPLEK